MGYLDRRKSRIKFLRLAIALISGALLAELVLNFHVWVNFTGQKALFGELDINEYAIGEASKIPVFGDIIKILVQQLLKVYPSTLWIAAYVIGFVAALFGLKSFSESLYTRCFEEFNDDVLARVGSPKAFDPLRGATGLNSGDLTLPWMMHDKEPRGVLFNKLLMFVNSLNKHRQNGHHFFGKPQTPFGWTLLLGRSGSGKSRMIVELARTLSSRHIFGDHSRKPTPVRIKKLMTWCRVQFMRLSPGNDDPWDAGWLRPGMMAQAEHNLTSYPEWEKRRNVNQSWLNKFSKWRPRRPTFLLLDDPLLNDAKTIIEMLESSSSEFLHPVALVIINQTAPSELGLSKPNSNWTVAGMFPPAIPPLTVTDECRFSETDIRDLRATVLPREDCKLTRDSEVRRFLEITDGYPLLVELGFKWLRENKPLSSMDKAALLLDRIERIISALNEAGLSATSHQRAIAVATLAGGSNWALKDVITANYPLPIDEASDLKRVFPVDELDLRNFLPPIRPETIGDAFVLRIFTEASDAERRRMTVTAWRANPRGMLRTVLRLNNRIEFIDLSIDILPPDELGFDNAELASAFAEAASLIPYSDWKIGTFSFGKNLESAARSLIDRIEPEKAFTFTRSFLNYFDACASTHAQHYDVACRLLMYSLQHAFHGEELPSAQDLISFLNLFSHEPESDARFRIGYDKLMATEYPSSLFLQSERVISREVDDLKKSSFWLEISDALRGNRMACLACAEKIDQISRKYERDRSIELDRINAWRRVAYACLTEKTLDPIQTIINKTDLIAKEFKLDPQFEIERIVVRRFLIAALSEKADAANCAILAQQIKEISMPFKLDREFQFELVDVYTLLAQAYSENKDSANTIAMAKEVERLAQPFLNDPNFALQCASAWRLVTFSFAQIGDAANSEYSARQVDRVVQPFELDKKFAHESAKAWRMVSFSFANQDNQIEAARAAAEVDRIVLPFHSDVFLEQERAVSWRNVTEASAQQKDGFNAKSNAQRVELICEPFKDLDIFARQRCYTWTAVALALSNNGDAAEAEQCAITVEAIGRDFPAIDEYVLYRTICWRHVTFAFVQRNDLLNAERAAMEVDRIASSFSGRREFEFERAITWRFITYLFCERHNFSQCEVIAQKVEKIAEPFMDAADFCLEVQTTRKILADCLNSRAADQSV